MFSKIRRYLNDHSAISIYKTMILPYFDYGDICYMSSNILEVKKLNNHHIRGLRICFRIQGKIEEKDLQEKMQDKNFMLLSPIVNHTKEMSYMLEQ